MSGLPPTLHKKNKKSYKKLLQLYVTYGIMYSEVKKSNHLGGNDMRFSMNKSLGMYKGFELVKTGKSSIQFYKDGKLVGYAQNQKQVKTFIDQRYV
jgi:hypothetical protein